MELAVSRAMFKVIVTATEEAVIMVLQLAQVIAAETEEAVIMVLQLA